jgi:chromosome partitioning protein
MDAWAWTGICLADEVLIPVQTEFLALQGLSQMMQTLREAAEETPGKAKLLAILATMVDFREPVTREILTDLRSNLGARLADTVILRDPAFIEAASHGKTVFEYDFMCKGARSYLELAREVIHGGTTTR